MSDDVFLARWSRRKREAKAVVNVPPPTEPAGTPNPAPPAAAENPPDAEVDLSSLPPIDSIDAATDITAFLRKGIPQELSRAALRRAWSADPAIRDFVGLAENAWDFNDPNAMAGFGALDYPAEQVDALVRRIVGGAVEATVNLTNPPTEASEEGARSVHAQTDFAQSSNMVNAITNPRLPAESAAAELPSNAAASQPEAALEEMSVPRRTHGGALPQ